MFHSEGAEAEDTEREEDNCMQGEGKTSMRVATKEMSRGGGGVCVEGIHWTPHRDKFMMDADNVAVP